MKRLRCAIYTRKSTDEGLEQEFNSLDAQREACAAYVKSQSTEGWSPISRTYDDGGYSGGTLQRPGLEALLADVKAKKIDIIVVHKIDRLTRSLLDFAKLVEVFESANTSFVSVTQAFNTTSSMGRLTLNMLLSFAQFEREITAERIRDKIAASKAKGMWMGGNPPLGYAPNGRSLKIVDVHAKLVREIFRRYLDSGNVRILTYELDRDEIRLPERLAMSGRATGGGKFTRGQLYRILSNPIYAGKIVHHDKVYHGQHNRIVSDELWNEVRDLLDKNRQGYHEKGQRAYGALLAGLAQTSDGRRLKSNHACKGRKRYRYYVAEEAAENVEPPIGSAIRIPSRELDAAVVHLICEALSDPLTMLIEAGVELSSASLATMDARVDVYVAAIQRMDYFSVRSLVRKVTVGVSTVEAEIAVSSLCHAIGMPDVTTAETLTLRSAARLTRTGSAFRLVQKNGRSVVRQRPRQDLAKHFVQARLWWDELKRGETRVSEIALRDGVNESWISRMVRLNFLAPAIVDKILNGSVPAGANLSLLRHHALPLSWSEQQKFLGLE